MLIGHQIVKKIFDMRFEIQAKINKLTCFLRKIDKLEATFKESHDKGEDINTYDEMLDVIIQAYKEEVKKIMILEKKKNEH